MLSLRATRRVSEALLALLAAGCQEPTQVTIDLSTDALCAGDPDVDDIFDSAAFYVTSAEALDDPLAGPFPDATTQPGQCQAGDPLRAIGTLGLIPGASGTDAPVGVRILVGIDGQTAQGCAEAGCGDARCIDVRRRVSFVPNQSLLLPVAASRNCLGLCCDEGETCFDGACVGVEVPPCDPDVQDCDPDDPDPPFGQRWSFGIPDAGFEILASRVRTGNDGSLVIAVAGSYPPRADNSTSPLSFGDQPLFGGTGNGVFLARIVVSASGEGSVSRVASCTGPDVEVHDLAFDDNGPVALVSRRQGLKCLDGASLDVQSNFNDNARPHLWHLNATPPAESLEPLYGPIIDGQNTSLSPSATTSLAFAPPDRGAVAELHVAGIHVGNPSLLTRDQSPISIPASAQPHFFRAILGASSPSGSANPWALGVEPNTQFAQAIAHQVVLAGTNAPYSVGLFSGGYSPLAVGDEEGAAIFAIRGNVLDERMVATGGIVSISRARRRHAADSVLVPVALDAERFPLLSLGDADPLPLEGRSVALLEFAPGSASLVLTGQGANPYAGGTAQLSCLVYERGDQGVLACNDQPERTFGEEVKMMGFEATADVEPAPIVWLVMMGRTRGDLGAGFPALDGLEAGPQLFFAGAYATN